MLYPCAFPFPRRLTMISPVWPVPSRSIRFRPLCSDRTVADECTRSTPTPTYAPDESLSLCGNRYVGAMASVNALATRIAKPRFKYRVRSGLVRTAQYGTVSCCVYDGCNGIDRPDVAQMYRTHRVLRSPKLGSDTVLKYTDP